MMQRYIFISNVVKKILELIQTQHTIQTAEGASKLQQFQIQLQ
jgi:hypothetical protein